MRIIERITGDDTFEVYRVEISEDERTNTVDGKTFRALVIIDNICRRFGIVVAVIAMFPLAIWTDFK